MGKYITRNVYNQRVDKETGEIMEYVEKVEVTRKDAEPFFLTYSKQIMALYGKSIFNATTKVLWKFLEFAEYNTGKVYITTERRNTIMDVCGISRASYDRAVRELVEAEIMKKEGNTYTIRHDMFWKGDRDERKKLLNARLKISFSPVFTEDVKD
jgi:hypothetical protein